MARIPLEDNFNDVINKTQRGMKITDADLAARAEVTLPELAAVKGGTVNALVIRRVARHLRLSPDALEALAHRSWYPEQPLFKRGFAMFNTPFEDMTVNSYLIWDSRTKEAAVFDTGANCEDMLSLIAAEKLRVSAIFLTHTHDDHIADLPKLVAATRATVCSCEVKLEPNLSQALHLLNGDNTHDRINQGKLIPPQLEQKKSHQEIIEHLYLTALSRSPTEGEMKNLQEVLKTATSDKQAEEILNDIFWAILNSKEFIFNH
jgi:hypothetical protein